MAERKTPGAKKSGKAAGRRPNVSAHKPTSDPAPENQKKSAPRRGAPASKTAGTGHNASPNALTGLRVRMYRVGFGDFFLISLPAPPGTRHILIDCGVHAGDIKSIADAIDDMKNETGGNLALLIVTHRHADHISGFASGRDVFRNFNVERIWMSWFENPSNKDAVKFQQNLTAVAAQLRLDLAGAQHSDAQQLEQIAENIIGTPLDFGAGNSNPVALNVLHGAFNGNKPPIDYYKAGDTAKLPQDLADAGLTAEILGPPIDRSLVSQMNNKNEQYLAAVQESLSTPSKPPFPDAFKTDASAFPPGAFKADQIEEMVNQSQPDLLAAKARQVDNTLNNQSVVVLFTFQGKSLLFVGDAQWGNWENFLYGGKVSGNGHAVITERISSALKGLDFYKVGHHGSANATPIDVVTALKPGCVAMCSTEPGYYGSASAGTEVPRIPLIKALDAKTEHRLALSTEVPAGTKGASGGVPPVFKVPARKLFIDYYL